MKTKTKKTTGASEKHECEVKHFFACNGVAVRKMTGPKKGDPEGWVCLGCCTYLYRQGVKLKEVK